MRKTRIFALLCAVVLMIGMVSVATAQTVLPATGVVERAMGWHNNLLLKNKKTATIYVWPDWTSYPFDKDGFDVDAILYECKGAVTGKSNVDWLTTKPIPRGFAIE